MQIRVKSGLPKPRPPLAPQTDGPLYLDEVASRLALFDFDHFPTSGDLRLDIRIRPGLSFDDLRPRSANL